MISLLLVNQTIGDKIQIETGHLLNLKADVAFLLEGRYGRIFIGRKKDLTGNCLLQKNL